MIQTMKLLSAIGLLVLAFSIACTAYKSASPTTPLNGNTSSQSSPQTGDSSGQSGGNCPLTMSVAPVIHGLKLGMTKEEVLALFPGSKDDEEVKSILARPASALGVSELIIRPEKFKSKENYTGINHITISFLDGRVSTFT